MFNMCTSRAKKKQSDWNVHVCVFVYDGGLNPKIQKLRYDDYDYDI